MIHDGEIARWLTVTFYAHSFIDRGEVVQHRVRLLDPCPKELQQFGHTVSRRPDGGNIIASRLHYNRQAGKSFLHRFDDIGLHCWQFVFFTPLRADVK